MEPGPLRFKKKTLTGIGDVFHLKKIIQSYVLKK